MAVVDPPARRVGGVRLQLWRAATAYRVATLLVDCYLVLRWQHLYARPVIADLVAVAAAVTTAGIGWLALTGRAHRRSVVAADVVITAVLTLASIAAQTPVQQHGDMPTLTTYWAAGPAIEAGFVGGWVTGTAAGVLQLLVAVVVRAGYDGRTMGSAVLLVIAGGIAGYVATLTVRAEHELEQVVGLRAALQERQRLARSVHDGVLQVLGLVHREGVAEGGRWAVLGAAAAEQERLLRALIRSDAAGAAQGTRDLADGLRDLASDRVTVSAPGGPVRVPATVHAELRAAVRAALDNVARHAGDRAQAWVLLEADEHAVRVTVRDDGSGMPADRLGDAEADGRLGVSESIRGRMRDLGGTAAVTSSPGGGTRVELNVPLPEPR